MHHVSHLHSTCSGERLSSKRLPWFCQRAISYHLYRLNAETTAFEREYVDDHSWEDLQEDEQGHLRALVRAHR